jgi:hypothetical protein
LVSGGFLVIFLFLIILKNMPPLPGKIPANAHGVEPFEGFPSLFSISQRDCVSVTDIYSVWVWCKVTKFHFNRRALL